MPLRINDQVLYSRTLTNTRKQRTYLTAPATIAKLYKAHALIFIEAGNQRIYKQVSRESLRKLNASLRAKRKLPV